METQHAKNSQRARTTDIQPLILPSPKRNSGLSAYLLIAVPSPVRFQSWRAHTNGGRDAGPIAPSLPDGETRNRHFRRDRCEAQARPPNQCVESGVTNEGKTRPAVD